LQNAGGFETSLRSASDWDLWLRLAQTGPVAFTADLGTRHLLPPTGVASGEARVRAACMSQILAAHAPRVMADTGGPEAVRRAQANLLAVEAELARLEGRRWTAVAANLRALLRTPSRQLGWIMLGDLLKAARRGKVRPLDRL
jgi:hypothetical protein